LAHGVDQALWMQIFDASNCFSTQFSVWCGFSVLISALAVDDIYLSLVLQSFLQVDNLCIFPTSACQMCASHST